MPSDETLQAMREAVARGIAANTIATQEIARLRMAGLTTQANAIEAERAAAEARLNQLRRAYNL